MRYLVQQKIATIADNYVALDGGTDPHFELDEVSYRQWDFTYGEGAIGDAWIAEGHVDAGDGNEAIARFNDKLARTVPIISLISQCYMEFGRQPLLLRRLDTDIAFVSYIYDSAPVGLMFMDEQYAGLLTLSTNTTIRTEFYRYWNDAQNSIGYSPKLLLMLSALEALVKKPNGTKDWQLLERILGVDLKRAIFDQRAGVRHRLVHGEYFSAADGGTDYVEQVHRKVVDYFNRLIGRDVISEDVVQPQRHVYDNKMGGAYFFKSKDGIAPLHLRDIVADLEANDHRATRYEYVFDEALVKGY